jgi:bifunctional non-homologous end joining protein LigD
VLPSVTPQLLADNGLRALRLAIAEPRRYAVEGKVDGVRGLITFDEGGRLGTRNRRGEARQWLRGQPLEGALRRLANRLPLLWHGTVLDGELVADRFGGTMAALLGSKRHGEALRYVAFDVPVLAGVDLRSLPWQERRERLELLARAFEPPVYLSQLVEPSAEIARRMLDGELEGVVLKDRSSPYRDGSRAGWWKVKDRSWYEREAWRFDRR